MSGDSTRTTSASIRAATILEAVALAGKGAHHTEDWGEHGYVEAIQLAANKAASELRSHRAQALSPEQATWIRAFVEAGKTECVARMGAIPPSARDALEALDRLLNGGGK